MCFFFAHAQTLYRMRSLCRSYECMNIVQLNIGFFTGFKKIKQRCISFVLGYLRMILWKISTAISIKHRILATFIIKKNIQCLPVQYSYDLTVNSFGKVFAHVRNCLLMKKMCLIWIVGRHHTIRWSILKSCSRFWFYSV
jgi:hypothetical protein